MSDQKFLKNYLQDLSALVEPDDEILKKLIQIKN